MHKGKVFSTKSYRLQPFTIDLQEQTEVILEGLKRIFSNKQVTTFNPNRIIKTDQDALLYLHATMNGYDKQTIYDYFLIDTANERLAGTIHLLSPKIIKKSYPALLYLAGIEHYSDTTWVVEYYLDPLYWNKGIMCHFLTRSVDELFVQGATHVCALTNAENIASIALLKKLNFRQIMSYNDQQGQVLWMRSFE